MRHPLPDGVLLQEAQVMVGKSYALDRRPPRIPPHDGFWYA